MTPAVEDEMPQEAGSSAQSDQRSLRAATVERGETLDIATTLEFLEAGGCPACRLVNQSMDRFFFWFALEHYQERGTIERVDAALGFCPRHCRTLIRSRIYSGTLTNVYLHIVAAALARLSGSGLDGPCIGCEQERWATGYAVGLILKTLPQPVVAEAYGKAGGFCGPHFLGATSRSTPNPLRVPLDVFEDRLSHADSGAERVSILTGTDTDSATRVSFLGRLPADPGETRDGKTFGALESLRAALSSDSCPACLAAGQAQRRYLRWIGCERDRKSSGFGREIGGICSIHLADLSLLDTDSAEWLANEKAAVWRGVLDRLRRRMREIPAPGFVGRLGALREAWSRLVSGSGTRNARIEGFRQAGSRALRPGWHWRRRVNAFRGEFSGCRACGAARTAGQRMTELLLAGLQDRPLAKFFESTHGLCLRHVLALPEESRSAVAQLCRTRLKLLEWELQEADRKLDWLVRYEHHGRELTSWARVMGQIDGEVFLGGEPTGA